LLEPFRGFVETPGIHISRLSIDDADDHIRIPRRRTGAIEFGGSRRMVRMTVINPDHIEASAPRVVVGMQQLKGIDDVTSNTVLGRHVLRTTTFEDAPRFPLMPDQEAAALLGEGVPRMLFDESNDPRRNLDYGRSSQ
jgi:hypothetical protein